MPAVVTGKGESFAILCFREDGRWQVELLPQRLTESIEGLLDAVRGQPGDVPSIAVASIDDDYFVVVRHGAGGEEVLLSDITAALDDGLAREVCDHLGVEPTDEEDVEPVGDLEIFTDLGVLAEELGDILGDVDAYGDEQIQNLVGQLGFSDAFADVVSVTVR